MNRGVKKKDEFINGKKSSHDICRDFSGGGQWAIFKASDFGTDPNSCFVMGVWNLAGIKYSYVYIAINALMLLGVFFLDRHFIGLETVLNLFFTVIIVEKGMQLFDRYLPERTFGVRVLLMCIAVVMMCLRQRCILPQIWVFPPMMPMH